MERGHYTSSPPLTSQKVVFGDKIPLYCNKIKKKHSLFEAGLKDQVTERPNDSAKKSKSVRPFASSSLVLKQLNSLISIYTNSKNSLIKVTHH